MKIFYLLILALLAGCAQQPEIGDNALIITAFSSDFDTKVSENAFESGDIIGIFLENNASNLRYETSDGSTWRGFGNIGEFSSGDNVTAYYPYSDNAKNANAIEVGGGVDFMICPATPITVADNKASANLKFKHVLSKLVVSMERPEEINGVKTVSLENIVVKNVFRKGIIDLTTEKISGLSDIGDVVLKSGEAIIIPQTVSRIEFVYKMEGGDLATLVHTKDLTLTTGTKTTLNAISNADLYFSSFLDLKNGDAQTNLPLSFYVAPGRKWELKSSAAWLTFSETSGVGTGAPITVNVNVAANTTSPYAPRKATLTLTDDKPSTASCVAMQNYSKFEISASSPNETVPKAGRVYQVMINSNKPWSVTGKTNVTVSPESGLGTTTVTITIPATTIYATRETKAVFATTGATIIRTWAGMQEQAPAGTVYVGGAWWRTANLGGTNPQDYGNFYKWGSTYAYDRSSGNIPAGHWNAANNTHGAALQPITQSKDYDYANISGLGGNTGGPIGDPCRSLGAYRTPTQTQLETLAASAKLNSTYKGVNGYFFGQSAGSCNNTTIKADCIFLSMAGFRFSSNGSLYGVGSEGDYRSSSVLNFEQDWGMHIRESGINLKRNNLRGEGFSVRCVAE